MARNGVKRRIYDRIVVDGESLHTLFDTGAWNNYVTRSAATRCDLTPHKLRRPVRTTLGGERTIHKHFVVLQGTIHKLPLYIEAFVLDDLGKGEDRKPLDLIFGLLAMEKWGVAPDVKRKKIDLTNFTREFIEFADGL